MARHKITIQPASEAEFANIIYRYQEAGLPPVGDTDAGIVSETFRDAHHSGLLGSALGRGVAGAKVMPLKLSPTNGDVRWPGASYAPSTTPPRRRIVAPHRAQQPLDNPIEN
jgi:hypothetical protein